MMQLKKFVVRFSEEMEEDDFIDDVFEKGTDYYELDLEEDTFQLRNPRHLDLIALGMLYEAGEVSEGQYQVVAILQNDEELLMEDFLEKVVTEGELASR